MSSHLSPYDTGERLQPFPWVKEINIDFAGSPADAYGRVDFDDDESSTVVSVVVKRDKAGDYTLYVNNNRANGVRVVVDGEEKEEEQP